jgi:hypothetical protein
MLAFKRLFTIIKVNSSIEEMEQCGGIYIFGTWWAAIAASWAAAWTASWAVWADSSSPLPAQPFIIASSHFCLSGPTGPAGLQPPGLDLAPRVGSCCKNKTFYCFDQVLKRAVGQVAAAYRCSHNTMMKFAVSHSFFANIFLLDKTHKLTIKFSKLIFQLPLIVPMIVTSNSGTNKVDCVPFKPF